MQVVRDIPSTPPVPDADAIRYQGWANQVFQHLHCSGQLVLKLTLDDLHLPRRRQ